jgi:hypothetical protein
MFSCDVAEAAVRMQEVVLHINDHERRSVDLGTYGRGSHFSFLN